MSWEKPNFSETVKREALEACNGYCSNDGCINRVVDFDHIMPNTKSNNNLFPLFIQSIFNCMPVCRDCHTNRKFKITYQWAEKYENFLQRLINGG